ncbi:MFS transporter [Anaerosacchariphilus sp. NSJ-68]|uniref:MFS transporter n=2 Tax=Lachnospiraceae TaxID=186803 RepID=A0A923RPF4_9FIRM|nr:MULTISPECIES: MFS transporter [Lachnospiraceae]MBC5660280.1 MFS transporter [Anaerosacchariphilus hominis]MBC5697872.1 MFS transporter [Roseburia difficilis]
MNEKLVNPSKKQWMMLLLCVIGGSIAPFFQYCHGTLTDYIMITYSVSYTEIGYLNTVYAFACGLGLFLAGAVANKKGCKFFTILGIGIMMVGHAMFYLLATSYPMLLISRVVSGLGNAFIYNAAYTLAVQWFQGTTKTGVAAGAMTASDGVGTFFALYVFSLLINGLGIKNGNLATIAVVAIIFVGLLGILKDPKSAQSGEEAVVRDESGKYQNVWNRNTIATCVTVTGVLGGLGIANYWGPSMLTDLGMASTTAGFYSSLFTVAGIVSSLVFGAISDKLGKRRLPTLIGGIGMVAGYILMILGNQSGTIALVVFGMILTGFCAYVAYPMAFATLSDTVCEEKLAAANGVIQGVSFLAGMFVFQQIVSVVKDMTDSYWIGLAFCAVLTLITNVFLVTAMIREKDEVAAEMAKKNQK